MKLIFILPALFLCSALFSQEAILRGAIRNDHAEPLVGVTVRIKATSKGAVTDVNGRYQVNLQPGTYTVELMYTGYETRTITGVTVRGGSDNLLDEELSLAANSLPEVLITARAISRDTTHCCYCVRDVWAEKIIPPAAEELFRSTVFPNPATDYFNLTLSEGIVLAEIYDTKGTLLRRTADLPAGMHRIPVGDLPADTYLIRLLRKNKIFGYPLVVVR